MGGFDCAADTGTVECANNVFKGTIIHDGVESRILSASFLGSKPFPTFSLCPPAASAHFF